ncbi:hypothetical protein L2E82_35335 [Cichorium intybus]|uniref:Uncharacterized protein n=1 Tax=Cichorium intybus TaxID=13427 RepID=A0ACB9BNL2_CICIN|nr:hypothetical protein L2E82_35335 [Cichorium intybus]
MEDSSVFEDVFVSIPRGGPIYIADMVGPLTNVSHFQSCIEDDLKDLKKELCLELTEQHRHEISVDELKILGEEELVDIAFQASLKGGNLTRDSSLSSEDCSDGTMNDCRILDDGKMTGKASKKLKRVEQKDTTHEDDYMAEVEKLARIKQKQEEDKSAARLHSFSGTCGAVACVTPSEKKERMSSFNSTSYLTQQVKSSSTREQIPVDDNEILLCIEVYNNKRSLVKTQEILVLGRQLLTELRDKIYCLTDEIMKLTKKHDQSGYFLIEDIFYNDLRESNSIDYSKPILDWLRESEKIAVEKWESIISGELQQKQKEILGSESGGPKLPFLKPRQMQATRFCDLIFRLGAGYLYCHQGDCKHLMVIRDMRLIHKEDVQNRAAYPLIMFQTKLRFHKCSICKIYKATKVTVDDKWTPENPCYFCGICYYMLHYSNNQLIYNDFKVFDYIHD